MKRKVNKPVFGHEKFNGTLTVYEICNTFDTDYKDHLVRTFTVSGSTLEECFKAAYPTERSLRYCFGYYIKFKDSKIDEQYREWKKNGVTIMMYYGGGVVD